MEEAPVPQTPKPNPFTTVTPLSKALALILFISLPFVGFYLGMQYQTLVTPLPFKVPSSAGSSVPVKSDRTPIQEDRVSSISSTVVGSKTAGWKTYTDQEGKLVFSYPPNWTERSGVFDDEKGNKVAELAPGHLTTKESLTCEQSNRILDEGGEVKGDETDVVNLSGKPPKVISQGYAKLGNGKWLVRITETMYEGGYPEWGGIWYPNHYCLKKADENRLFYISFYEYSPKPKNMSLYNQILATFKFLP